MADGDLIYLSHIVPNSGQSFTALIKQNGEGCSAVNVGLMDDIVATGRYAIELNIDLLPNGVAEIKFIRRMTA